MRMVFAESIAQDAAGKKKTRPARNAEHGQDGHPVDEARQAASAKGHERQSLDAQHERSIKADEQFGKYNPGMVKIDGIGGNAS